MDEPVEGLEDVDDDEVELSDSDVEDDSSESDDDVEFHALYESDGVPGAKLNTSALCLYNNTQLKRWLKCRNLPTTGTKALLEKRITDHVALGQSHVLYSGIDDGAWLRRKKVDTARNRLRDAAAPLLPVASWKDFPSMSIPSLYNHGHVYFYLVESLPQIEVLGGLLRLILRKEEGRGRGSEKIQRIARRLLKSRFVGYPMDCKANGVYFVKSFVRATMRTKEYFVTASISELSGSIIDASCECLGRELKRCSHIGALLFYVADYAKKHGYEDIACTSKPREWGRGTVVRDPGATVQGRYYDLLKWNVLRRHNFDPRPTCFQNNNQLSQEELGAFVDSIENSDFPDCAFTKALPKFYRDAEITFERLETLVEEINQFYEELQELINPTTQPFQVPGTELQHLSHRWVELRPLLFTASIAKQIKHLSSPEAKMAFLRRKLYDPVKVTAAMQYGIDNEDKARAAYLKKKEQEDPGLMLNPGGLWVDMQYPFLGASPDNIVIPSGDNQPYLVEYKCLQVVKNIHPKKFRKHLDKERRARFPLKWQNKKIILKRSHSHFYQVQMQMGITRALFCDYVVWSRKGTVIVKVDFDEPFWNDLKNDLIFKHRNVFAPEYILKRANRDLLPYELDLQEEVVEEALMDTADE